MRAFLLSLLLFSAVPVLAQPKTPSNFTFSAPKQVLVPGGARLYGSTTTPARVDSPQLTVVAPTIAFDIDSKTNQVTQVRALGGVNLKVNMTSKTPGDPVTHVESTSQEATLTVATRTLVLTKNVNGFYQQGNGAKNLLSGDAATLVYGLDQQLTADIRGGDKGVMVTVPSETIARPDALSMVTITSENANINQKTGMGTFTGHAHAVGTGPNAFDVTADEFVLTRNATDNTISTLVTHGRTHVKMDLPPSTAPVTTVAAAGSSSPSSVGRPTHVEVNSDNAVIVRATNTATFNGNVKGFYRLQPDTGPPQNYNFTGDQAIIHYDATTSNVNNGLNVEISKAVIETPGLDLGM